MTRSNRNVYLLIGSIRDCIVCLLLIRNDYGISRVLIVVTAEAVALRCILRSQNIQAKADRSSIVGRLSVGLVADGFRHVNLHAEELHLAGLQGVDISVASYFQLKVGKIACRPYVRGVSLENK